MMPDIVKVLREIKGDDMYIVIRLKKLGEYVKKIDDCSCGRSSCTKIKLYIFSPWIFTPKGKIITICNNNNNNVSHQQ